MVAWGDRPTKRKGAESEVLALAHQMVSEAGAPPFLPPPLPPFLNSLLPPSLHPPLPSSLPPSLTLPPLRSRRNSEQLESSLHLPHFVKRGSQPHLPSCVIGSPDFEEATMALHRRNMCGYPASFSSLPALPPIPDFPPSLLSTHSPLHSLGQEEDCVAFHTVSQLPSLPTGHPLSPDLPSLPHDRT